MGTKAWFPTLIYEAPLQPRGAAALNEELLREAALFRREDAAGRAWSKENYPGGYTSYGSLNKLHKVSSTFTELQGKLDRHVRAFARKLDWALPAGKALEMTDCWLNVMPRRVAHGLHLHPTSVVSGTYYVQTPPGCSGIKFEDPRLPMFMAAPPRRPRGRPEQRPHVVYEARAGRVILFESWLRHEVVSNPVAEERVSISFNYSYF
ncbi:MAG: hypothetical protein KF878_32085 [Planctomycetes bacterium]|nr:hypothetical protein [Planctomycetota bacterium]